MRARVLAEVRDFALRLLSRILERIIVQPGRHGADGNREYLVGLRKRVTD